MKDDRPGTDVLDRAMFSVNAAAPYCEKHGSPIIAGWLKRAAIELDEYRGSQNMNLEQLEENRQQALAHLNVVRRMREVLLDDIRKANACDELVSMATLDLSDQVTMFEGTAVREYMRACQAVDDHRARLAGLPESTKP